MEEIKGERNEFQSDGAGNHHQNGLDLGVFEVQIMTLLIQNVLWLYAEMYLLLERGNHFRKIYENMLAKELRW